MKKQVKIEIKGERESAQEFVNAWHKAEKKEASESPVDHIYFGSLETLLKVLSPRRLEALKKLHNAGPLSIKALAEMLKRDYKNIYEDIKALERVGLVVKTEKVLIAVPWDKISAEIQLAA
jgi:predicted transcriptional regulator